jgi:hypothetical protein
MKLDKKILRAIVKLIRSFNYFILLYIYILIYKAIILYQTKNIIVLLK